MQNLSLNENLDKLELFIGVVYKELGLVSKQPRILFEERDRLNASHSMDQNYIKFKGNWRLNTTFLYNCPISKRK